MNIADLRRVFERVELLAPDDRHAVYRAEGLDARTIERLEAMLLPDERDAIASVIGAAAERALADRLPERIGPWRVLRPIGEGGMGIVLLAERDDGEYERTVAIKLIRGMETAGARERMQRERQALAALEHPNIAGLIDAGTTPSGDPYLVMPYVQGPTLGEWMHRNPSLEARLRVFIRICRAVHHAHSHLVVHRDIKPGNVIVRDDDTPVLLDFGIAKLLDPADGGSDLRTATRVMTSAYASPEQLLGRAVTTATDVFALGLLLYELLAGSLPERGDLIHAATAELPPPSVHAERATSAVRPVSAARLRGDLDRVIRRAVRSDPLQRYPSALALAEDIEAFLDGRPVQAAGRHGWYLTRRFVQRHRWLVLAAGVAASALLTVSLQWRWQADKARQAEIEALREAAAASEITEFLLALFAELDPEQNPGRQLSARELLDIGRQRLGDVGDEGPELAERLQAGLGRVYASIGEPLIAIELLEQLDPQLIGNASPAVRIRVELALARAYRDAVRPEAVEQAAMAALGLARAMVPPDRLAEAEALMYRGVAEQMLLRPEEAYESFIEAQTLYQAEGSMAGLSSVLHNRAWLAEERGDNR
jgi:serine/threonine-protein kinase